MPHQKAITYHQKRHKGCHAWSSPCGFKKLRSISFAGEKPYRIGIWIVDFKANRPNLFG
jgi:hypothetical protein